MAITLAKEALDVGIITNNGEKMLAFYRDVLGLAQEPSIPFPGLGTIHRLVCGNSILRIVAADNAIESVAGGAFASRNGIRYMTINITNLDEVVADRLVPVRQRAEEALEAGHGLALDIEAPVGEPLQAGGAVGGGVEDVGQILAQFIGSTQGRGAHRANASSHSMKTP